MTYTSSKQFSFQEFITQYGDNTSYELIDGELIPFLKNFSTFD